MPPVTQVMLCKREGRVLGQTQQVASPAWCWEPMNSDAGKVGFAGGREAPGALLAGLVLLVPSSALAGCDPIKLCSA